MQNPPVDIVPYVLFAAFLLVGLVVYERRGYRLGGIIVLPLLLIYAVFDLQALLVFGLAAALVLAVGDWLHEHALVYGRRLFVIFLILSVAATVAAKAIIGTTLGPFTLAILPGLFAYNVHREGDYAKGIAVFSAWLSALLLVTLVLLWVTGLRQPPAFLTPLWGSTTTAAAAVLGPVTANLSAGLDRTGATLQALSGGFPGPLQGPMASATVAAAAAQGMGSTGGEAE